MALKKLKDKSLTKEFYKEAGTLRFIYVVLFNPLSQVIHPNCVRLIGIYTSDTGDQYLVTEYVRMGNLKTFIESNKSKLKFLDLLAM